MLTQKTAYAVLRAHQNTPYTRHTLINLDITRFAIKELTNQLETNETIWLNIRHPDICRPIQNFLLRAMTGSQKIGAFWSNIPNYEQRAICALLQFFLFLCCSSLASLPYLHTVLQNALHLNTASFLRAVHGFLILFPLAFYGRPSLTRIYLNAVSSLLSHRPSLPFISTTVLTLQTLLGLCVGSPHI